MSPKDSVSAGGVSAQQLAEIEARLNAATPGPWRAKHRHCDHEPPDDESCGLGLEIVGPPEASNRGQFYRGADAVFIAHAPSDIAVLVEAVKALRAALEPFVCIAPAYCTDTDVVPTRVRVGDLRRAAAVLGTRQEGP